ncbi:MAG TPA: HPF/RaiA family ribosome-associated protein [Candidatus Acidoferrales bacterium]|nr:HPF/RaiA family ribosome-associated protein [Candidatus Acidoferrales bacterium]
MQLPLQVTFRGIEPSAAVEERIRERATKLDQFHDHIIGCRVVVETPHRHHHQGKLFHVRIDVTVPHHELVVNREPLQHKAFEDVYVAIRDAFDAAERQLENLSRKQNGFVKHHANQSRDE